MAVPTRQQVEDYGGPAAIAFLPPGGGEHEPALEAFGRSADALLLVSRQLGQLRGTHGPAFEHGFGDVALDGRELLLAEVVGAAGAARQRVEGTQQSQ